ncbi:MAG: ATP-dependent 6-phosphofructokinase [Erysipelotrichia bacterium]|nr:ATP-dependent 6-phosphofructokinase [Erysipelotrichia bacterium]
MKNGIKKIGVLTGGGDCPGLNAVLRAVTRTAILEYDLEVIGYLFGYRGLYKNDFIKLDLSTVSGIQHRGGTIIFSSNKDNLFNYNVEENGNIVKRDVSDVAIENMKKEGVDAMIIIGGDGTLTSARDFSRKGVKLIGVPKTIDNDLAVTDVTFGFNSAVEVATYALNHLHTTAESHHRVMILEVMGRNTGWIALEAGIAGSADVILIPEIPFKMESIIEKIHKRELNGKLFSIIVISEGATQVDGKQVINKIVADSPDPVRLGGVGIKLAEDLEKEIYPREVRCTVLGHLHRGGSPTTFDRVLSTRYGVAAVHLLNEGLFGNMVCIENGKMYYEHLENIIGRTKFVDPKGELVNVARSIGISLGD